jgi:hypothetical protein
MKTAAMDGRFWTFRWPENAKQRLCEPERRSGTDRKNNEAQK